MCGIVGFVSTRENKDEIIENMMETIIHRGPNSSGKFTDDNVALGFRRLSIVDLEGGSQPIFNEDDTKVVIFNGEIYNYEKIRDDLKAKGHIFKTSADTEVILHGYEEYGKDIVKQLRGMFSFAIWDRETNELFGARDHFGIKPYYYAEMNGTFMFGSEIKSFLEHPDFVKELNKKALKPYMTFQYSALEETFFKNVYRIPEGHYYTYSNGELKIERYWDAEFSEKDMSLEEAVDMIDAAVDESVKAHTTGEVNIGAFLSSGVDSSYVASVLRPDNTFSIGFGDKSYNESHEAKRLTDKLGLNNTSKVVTGEEAFEYFPLIQYHLDEPDSNPSCVPLYFLSEMAAKDATIVLSGEGADELFAGYQNYGFNTRSKPVRVFTESLKKLPKKARYSIARTIKKAPNFKGSMHMYTSLAPAEDFFIGQAEVFKEDEADTFLQPEFQKSETIKEIVNRQYKKVKDLSEVKKMQYLDLHQWMPKDILLKADKLSMANSIELRVPLLDVRLMEVAQQIPTKHLLNAENTKYAFRKAANRHLPDEWADREKLGFPVPIKDWLRTEKFYLQVREMFNEEFVGEFFEQDKIIALLDDNFKEKNDERRKIWTIYTFLTWYKIFFIDGTKPVVA
ncbi:asparagine synthase (glutamine-hydrolyzing) [Vagococcus intermedius]|uniref:asparagine synthase (glutamine-hydrolyzing) n=1 Tax=Vagococcus intermedius TaxID=2991418 RepID=A0AAF0I7E5_9ENTE|nr:asparagine synthase (glutamine-hydrolyzing) [Vagococcus intermedius]WEG74278.1 asparagine synthase (glutamine-hydrolyzing) [Vagococcus intermedius]WEG76360.1 asparagine synthase (glutamine-hydrolyzing) [Vagococcus intermedius]